ncbi:hypothetical protein [Leptospira interrogans]|uniref:hypothetical protein n=1 Tax=Leptospira interrogans TaxID=173 RepID=UPI0002BE0548|nr:hypothetical protein [Leptospira interrogans]EMJ56530.1 hypothetical protein LEP1GSC111_1235 [Leptospira interrogans str. UT126]UMQ60486.1 hypothetical protein FH585_21430 [Leptospira interrogans]UMQ60580.1 hypothetical protein FH585_21325 [Leptospira interrogans]
MKLKNIWLVLVSFIFLMAGNLLGLGDPSYVMLGLVPATFTDIKSLTEFTKTFNANSQGITDVAALTNGAATTIHSLDEEMVLFAQSSDDYKFLNTMHYKDTKSTLNVYGRILDWGGNGDFSFVGEADDAEFKDVTIDRIANLVSYLAEGYAVSKVLDMSDTGSFDPEAIQVEGAINRIMQTIAYSIWYGNKGINGLEFSGFVTELVKAGQVYDAQGGFPDLKSIKELAVNIRTHFGFVNEFWLHDSVKNVLDNYYVGAKEFIAQPSNGDPSIGYNIPSLIGAPLRNNKLDFKTDLWINRHLVPLPTYRDANGVKTPGKTNPKAPDQPTATAVVSGGSIFGSKWKFSDIKDRSNADSAISYKIVACNRYGRSAASATVTTPSNMVKGRSIILTITPAGSGEVADYYQIFRESQPGNGDFRLTERIAKSSGATTVYSDVNEWIPGCTEGVMGDFNAQSPLNQTRTYQMFRMLPMLQTKFPPNAVYQRKLAGMVEFYGGLAVLQPYRFYLVKNLPTSMAAA